MTTSYNAQDMAVQLEDMQSSITALRESTMPLPEHIRQSTAALQGIVHLLTKEYALKDIDRTETISPTTPIRLDRAGRRYIAIFSPVAVNNVAVDSMGIQNYQLNLIAGWNVILFPDGTVLTGASGTNQPVIIKYSNSLPMASDNDNPAINASNYGLVLNNSSQAAASQNVTALTNALAALPGGVGTVLLPVGDIYINAQVAVTADQNMLGQGMDATFIISTSATFDMIKMGNRQTDGIMRNNMGLSNMTVSHAGGASSYACVVIDGGGQGTHIVNVTTNQGAYGFRLTDLDRCYFIGLKANNVRNDAMRLEVGKENTYGTVSFYACSVVLSDNNTIGWHMTANADQGSPNPFDRVIIDGSLFFMTTGLTGCVGLQIDNPGVTSMTARGCLFEQNLQHVALNKYSNIHFEGCTFLDSNNAATDCIIMSTDNHDVTITSCVFQQATNVFHIISGFPSIIAQGRSKNNGNITNIVNGSTSLKSGTDTNFMGANNIDLGSTANTFLHIFTNQLDMSLQNDTALSNSSTIATYQKGVLPVTATGAVTGIILATGNDNPSSVCVVNKSAFTVTFATQATSNVAGSNGSNIVIPANQMMWFTWLGATSLWYPQT